MTLSGGGSEDGCRVKLLLTMNAMSYRFITKVVFGGEVVD